MIGTITPEWSERLGRYGLNRMNASPGAEVLASWLSDDVGSTAAARSLADRLKDVDGIGGGYVGSGNSYHLRVAKGFVFVENQFLEAQAVLLKISDAILLLSSYERFHEAAKRGKGSPPESIDVEFEMEGQQAVDFYLSTGLPLGKGVTG